MQCWFDISGLQTVGNVNRRPKRTPPSYWDTALKLLRKSAVAVVRSAFNWDLRPKPILGNQINVLDWQVVGSLFDAVSHPRPEKQIYTTSRDTIKTCSGMGTIQNEV